MCADVGLLCVYSCRQKKNGKQKKSVKERNMRST